MKGYSKLHRSPELEPHYQIQFSVLSTILPSEGVLFLSGDYNKRILSPTDWLDINRMTAPI